MDLVAGAMGNLSSKLLELLKEEYKLQTGVHEKIRSLSQELEIMHAALHKVAQVPPEQLDEQVRLWARDVREASYEMEDVLDTFLVRVEGAPQPPTNTGKAWKRFLEKMGKLFRLRERMARRKIAGAIEGINRKVQEMAERHVKYRVDHLVDEPAATTCSIDPRLSTLYTNSSQLVGIEEPRDTLIKMLSMGDGMSDKKMKIVSIVGFGGLGKTTLAKAVQDKLHMDFHDKGKAFVSVGRYPVLKKVLRDILIDLDKERYMKCFNLALLDERQLITEIREFLKNKRYFIVIDDIWDVTPWDTIKLALHDNNLESKIVITTRNHDIAKKVGCSSYTIESLPPESSEILFYGRIFGSKDKCPRQFLEVSEMFLKKCGGMPLAIITTSSLLANKPRNIKEWCEMCDSIGSGLQSNSDMDSIRKILSLSYYDLPSHLKTCFLYLSIFPEDCKIMKDRLIWRWISEDFVRQENSGQSLFLIGESYYNELVNRSLIQPVANDYLVHPEAFCVHDMVLDLICYLSIEEAFVATIFDDSKQSTSSSASMVRRLCLRSATWPTVNVSKIRSLTIISPGIVNSMSSLSYYRLLRVLDLEDCNLQNNLGLKFIGNLFHLRYLGLRSTSYAGMLPVDIGKLQFLQTLDLKGTKIKELPPSVVWLRQLICLYVEEITTLPNGMRNLTSLEVLETASVDSAYSAEELGHLTQLTTLEVRFKDDESLCKALAKSLSNLRKIQTLLLNSGNEGNLECSMESLGNLRRLSIHFASLPKWINPSFLPLLSFLSITLKQVKREDIQVLGMLPALSYLVLHTLGARKSGSMKVEKGFLVSSNAFPCVRYCRFYGFATGPSMFPAGAMPKLEIFSYSVGLESFISGGLDDLNVAHFPSLRSVHIEIEAKADDVGDEVMMRVQETLSLKMSVHPNNPSITVRRGITFYIDELLMQLLETGN